MLATCIRLAAINVNLEGGGEVKAGDLTKEVSPWGGGN